MRIPFFGPSGWGRSPNMDPSRLVNWYPEISTGQEAKAPVMVTATPGLGLYKTVGSGPIRALYTFPPNLMIAVSGASVYQVYPYVAAPFMTLETSTGPVSISDNGIQYPGSAGNIGGNQILIVDGARGYIRNVLTGVNTDVTASMPNSVVPKMVAFIDGYFVAITDTMSFHVSDLWNGLVWNPLAQSPLSSTPGTLQALMNYQNQMYFLKSGTSEIWYDSGTPTSTGSPLARIPGAVIDIGTVEPYSVCKGGGALLFLGFKNVSGSEPECIGVVQMQSTGYKVVSTPGITYRIQQLVRNSNRDDAYVTAYMYNDAGHTFYVITLPTGTGGDVVDAVTFVYDVTTEMWHERSSFAAGGIGGAGTMAYSPILNFPRHLSNCYAPFNQKHYVGDYRNGNIYEMGEQYYTDAGDPIVSTRVTGHIFNPEDDTLVFLQSLYIDCETGTTDLVDGNVDPVAFLSWSNDYGRRWSSRYPASMGKLGDRTTRLRWRRLGCAEDYVFRLDVSDPVRRNMIAAFANVGI